MGMDILTDSLRRAQKKGGFSVCFKQLFVDVLMVYVADAISCLMWRAKIVKNFFREWREYQLLQ